MFMSRLWVNLKRNKVYADIYLDGVKIVTISVNELNKGNTASITLESESDIRYKIVKTQELIESDEDRFNREEFNR